MFYKSDLIYSVVKYETIREEIDLTIAITKATTKPITVEYIEYVNILLSYP